MHGERHCLNTVSYSLLIKIVISPNKVRWSHKSVPDKFYNQSAALEVIYYQTQIMIHRSFITSHKATPVPFPSLAICTNAARSTSRILRLHYEHIGLPYPWMMVIILIVTKTAWLTRILGAGICVRSYAFIAYLEEQKGQHTNRPKWGDAKCLCLHAHSQALREDVRMIMHSHHWNNTYCSFPLGGGSLASNGRYSTLLQLTGMLIVHARDTLFILASSGSTSLIREFPPSEHSPVSRWTDQDVTRVTSPQPIYSHISQPARAVNNYGLLFSCPGSLLPEELVDVPFSQLLDAYAASESPPILTSSETITRSTSEPSFYASDLTAPVPDIDWTLYAAPPSNIDPAPDARQFPYNFIGILGEEMCTQNPAPNDDARSFWTFAPSNTE